MIDRPYGYARIQDASCSATVSVTADKVSEACASWASDMGWVRTEKLRPLLVFTFFRCSWSWGGPEVQVVIDEADGRSNVTFNVSQSITVARQVEDLARAVKRFVDGVCSDLRQQGATVSPSTLGLEQQNRQRLKVIDKWRRFWQQALLILFIPACLGAYIADRSATLLWAVGMVMGGLVPVPVFIHYRIVGMRAKAVLTMLCVYLVYAFGASTAIILYAAHVIR